MTSEEIAENIYPKGIYESDSKRTEDEYSLWVIQRNKIDQQKRDHLVDLITTLQKETWDQACKALLAELNAEREDEAQYTYYPPFNLDK